MQNLKDAASAVVAGRQAASRAAEQEVLPQRSATSLKSPSSCASAKFNELHEEAKSRHVKRDRTTEEVEYERAKKECTF